jgi:effector-binding domain-containing protein
MPIYEVVLKKVDPQWVAAIHRVIPTYGDAGPVFREVFAHLAGHQVKPAGPQVAIFYDTEFRERDVDVEVAIPVASSTPSSEHVAVRQLPGIDLAACVVYQGAYTTIGDAYTVLMQWIEANGYGIAGPNREVYLRGPDSGPIVSSYMTEVQFPVEKA